MQISDLRFSFSRITRMNICDEFEIIVKCSWQLRSILFIHECAHFKTVNVFSRRIFVRIINAGNFKNHNFELLTTRFKTTNIGCN